MRIISKEEAAYVRSVVPCAVIRKTMKQKGSKRGHYFVEETKAVINALSDFNNVKSTGMFPLQNTTNERANIDEHREINKE